jgi:CO/xanthine dehydrogenase Mo-binding subunit
VEIGFRTRMSESQKAAASIAVLEHGGEVQLQRGLRQVKGRQVEGQVHGGVAQGLGLALMEEYVSGRTDNLHDYLIPTVGDVPPIVVHLVEDPEPLGPWGAKGVGEPALVATAPAILNAIRRATGVRPTRVPVTPDRLRAALLDSGSTR